MILELAQHGCIPRLQAAQYMIQMKEEPHDQNCAAMAGAGWQYVTLLRVAPRLPVPRPKRGALTLRSSIGEFIMHFRQLALAGLASALCSQASADMLNISTTGYHSGNTPQIACSIVSTGQPTYQGYRVLFVFAEKYSNGVDPLVLATSLSRSYEAYNFDWQDTVYVNDVATDPFDAADLYSSYLRLPNAPLDAGLVFFALPGEAVCAYSWEETNSGAMVGVSVSITDVTKNVLASSGTEMERKFAEGLRRHQEAVGQTR